MPTLYVKEQGATLSREGERIVARLRGKVLLEMPIVHVDRVMVFGNVHLTTPLTGFLLNRGIDTVFLSSNGAYRGRLLGAENGNHRLRRVQYAMAENAAIRLSLAKGVVAAKMRNQAALLSRRKGSALRKAARKMRYLAGRSNRAKDLDALRGYEGTGARWYFGVFGQALKNGFTLSGRIKRPPTDPVNALLSLGYTLLYGDMLSVLYAVGFDPFVGFYHDTRAGHAALASDLIEEFRAPIVDVTVLSVCNRGTIVPEDFEVSQNGSVKIPEKIKKIFLQTYEQRMQTRVTVPVAQIQFPYRSALEQQARCLADVLLQKRDVYVPFEMKP